LELKKIKPDAGSSKWEENIFNFELPPSDLKQKNMKTKSIKGISVKEIHKELDKIITKDFNPNLAIVFISVRHDINKLNSVLRSSPQSTYFAKLKKLSILFFTMFLVYSCSQMKTQGKEKQLAGMYKLYISENQDEDGNWHEDSWTKGGTGYIVYDGQGHVAVQITPKGYKDFSWLSEKESILTEIVAEKTDSMTLDELKEAVREFASSYVYIANYTIEDTANIVQHHRISSSIPAIWGTTGRRSFRFSGDTLILQVLNGNRRLKWIKQS